MMKNGKFITPPKLEDLLQLIKLDVLACLRVALPGTIESYDDTAHTAVIVPGLQTVYNDGSSESIKKLQDCPVFTLQGGGVSGVHFQTPIKEGDECLVVFADACIDQWHQLGGQPKQLVNRMHSLSDGFAIVGYNSIKGLKGWSTPLTSTEGGIGLTGGASKVAIDSTTGLVVVNSKTKSLKTVLDELVTAVSGLSGSPSPDNNILGIVSQLTDAILAVTTALSIDTLVAPGTKLAAITQAAVMTAIKTTKIPALQSGASTATGNVSTDLALLLKP